MEILDADGDGYIDMEPTSASEASAVLAGGSTASTYPIGFSFNKISSAVYFT
jgi:hypothetical protein